MANKPFIFAAAASLAVLGLGVGGRLMHTAPAGQPPLATLDAAGFERLRADFNAHAGEVRILALLSPT